MYGYCTMGSLDFWVAPEGRLGSFAAQWIGSPHLCWSPLPPFPDSFQSNSKCFFFNQLLLLAAVAATGLLSERQEGVDLTLLLFYQTLSGCNLKPWQFLDIFTNSPKPKNIAPKTCSVYCNCTDCCMLSVQFDPNQRRKIF